MIQKTLIDEKQTNKYEDITKYIFLPSGVSPINPGDSVSSMVQYINCEDLPKRRNPKTDPPEYYKLVNFYRNITEAVQYEVHGIGFLTKENEWKIADPSSFPSFHSMMPPDSWSEILR